MTKACNDRGDVGQAIWPFVRDQDAHVLDGLRGHAFETAIYTHVSLGGQNPVQARLSALR